jgi:ribulose-bisphosphate carboxylase small chain
MRSFALIALFSFSAQVHAEEPAVTDMSDNLADKLVAKLANKLVEAPFLQNASLDTATLGKPGTLQSSLSTKKIPAPARAISPAQSMQAYSPYNGKKYETLSYLPQLSNEAITKQISYMLRNNWTPALEFSDDGDVYLNTRMGPGYYDNRYWSMYKLPMFGCQDPSDVVREIESCKKEFPNAKVRVIAYDSQRQMQVVGFIVKK